MEFGVWKWGREPEEKRLFRSFSPSTALARRTWYSPNAPPPSLSQYGNPRAHPHSLPDGGESINEAKKELEKIFKENSGQFAKILLNLENDHNFSNDLAKDKEQKMLEHITRTMRNPAVRILFLFCLKIPILVSLNLILTLLGNERGGGLFPIWRVR
jgi:hypothetical protein